jgi:endosialidase-like protein
MVVNRSPILRFILTLLVIAMPVAMFAAPVGKAIGGGSSIQWQLSVSGHDHVILTVSAPDGEVYSKEFAAGTPVEFSAKDLPALVDGEYTYQLTVVQRIPAGLREQLAAARNSGDEAGARGLIKKAGLEPIVQTGGFAVVNGAIVSPDREETNRTGGVVSNAAREPGMGKEPSSASAAPRPGTPVVNDQVIPDDLIVQGSACVGLDCVNNESFGFDTIRLKENNTRIKFDDTSTGAGFPANDWQLTANDSASGGSSKFSIEDITGSKVPFTVTAGASTNSIFVDSTGRVGFRTSTPVLDLHVATSNTPALRLEQNNSGGFTAQTWDIAGNEANFFVRDVTGGSRLPFRIRPGAPTSSIDISASGNVGVGTASPSDALHVTSSDAATSGHGLTVANTSGTGADRTLLSLTNGSGAVIFKMRNSAVATAWQFFASNSFQFDNTNNTGVEMNLDPSGNMTILGTLTQGSSREIKEGFGAVTPAEILQKVVDMPITTWVYKNQSVRHIGPMAEDFYGAFQVGQSPKGISPTDTAGVAFAAIQGLNDVVQQKEKEISELKARLDKLEAMITSQQQH